MSPTDTSNFEDVDEQVEMPPPSPRVATFTGTHLPFIGFSYSRESEGLTSGLPQAVAEAIGLATDKRERHRRSSDTSDDELDRVMAILSSKDAALQELQSEADELFVKLEKSQSESGTTYAALEDAEEEIKILLEANKEASSRIVSLERTLDESAAVNQELESQITQNSGAPLLGAPESENCAPTEIEILKLQCISLQSSLDSVSTERNRLKSEVLGFAQITFPPLTTDRALRSWKISVKSAIQRLLPQCQLKPTKCEPCGRHSRKLKKRWLQ